MKGHRWLCIRLFGQFEKIIRSCPNVLFFLIISLAEKIWNQKGSDFPRVLVANKKDLQDQRQISTEEGMELASEWRCPYFETSAKNNEAIADTFTALLAEIEASQPGAETKDDWSLP